MPNKNFDGIKSGPKVPRRPGAKKLRPISDVRRPKGGQLAAPRVNSRLVANRTARPRRAVVPVRPASFGFVWNKTYLLTAVVVVIAFIAFASGVGFALQTPKTDADSVTSAVPAGTVANLGSAPPAASATTTSLSGVDIFNLPLQVLQTYFQNPETGDLVLNQRQVELKQFLTERNSPLADVSDTIAEQPHWQLILAISFAESTLGKNCYNFNCSGIGGASSIKSYKSLNNWVLDFNRLLDQKYNNWTLNQMCGVYVKPCTSSWLYATSQILTELKQANIN
jgi:hypothetical protein